MVMKTLQRLLLTTLACVLLVSGGCGGEGIERRAVTGIVRLDGKPLPQGTIAFTPVDKGPSAGGPIKDGAFTLAKDGGPSPGKYRVEVYASRPSGKTERDAATGETVALTESIIPPKYNRDSTLQVEVTTSGENRFDFDLQSKP